MEGGREGGREASLGLLPAWVYIQKLSCTLYGKLFSMDSTVIWFYFVLY